MYPFFCQGLLIGFIDQSGKQGSLAPLHFAGNTIVVTIHFRAGAVL